MPAWSSSSEGPLGYRLLSSVFTWQEERALGSLIRALIPAMKAPPSSPNYFPKALSTNTITLEVRVFTYELGGGGNANIKSVAHWDSLRACLCFAPMI